MLSIIAYGVMIYLIFAYGYDDQSHNIYGQF